MNSLRRRLTVSYTVLVGAFISLLAIVLTWLAFDATVQPLKDAMAADAREAVAISAADPSLKIDALVVRLRSSLGRPDVGIFSRRFGFPPAGAGGPGGPGGPGGAPAFNDPGFNLGPPPNGYPRPGTSGGEPPFPANGAPDGFGGGPGGPGGAGDPGSPPRQNGPGPNDFGGPGLSVAGLLGVHPQIVRVGAGEIIIAPDRARLEGRMQLLLLVLIGAIVFAFVAAWLIARWIAAQAVAPLIAVTGELQRFAAGDFTPREVAPGRRSDVGDLIEAYNGAAAQVAAAFDERERGEARMRRFLADAGHELRTPLSIIVAYIDVLRKGGIDDTRLRDRAFETLGSETTRMRRLVERLVALARLESPETTQPVVVDLGAIAGDAVAAVVAARGGDVACNVESGAFVRADPGDLHEAITNLVDNALKYGAGSAVTVTVQHAQSKVAIRVTDRGPGIPEVDREKIFERFYRSAVQQTIEGSGLGLAIAKRAAERAGGELTLERTGAGETTFLITLPLDVGGNPNEPEMRYTG